MFAAQALALGRYRVDLVDEDDARRLFGCIVEQLAQEALGFTVELLHDLGAADREKVDVGLVRDGTRDQRLAAARRSVQQHPFGRVNAEPHEHFRKAQWQFDDLANPLHLALEPANVLVRQCVASSRTGLGFGLCRPHRQQRVGRNQHRTLGLGLAHQKVQ